jgi:hypothetical protein
MMIDIAEKEYQIDIRKNSSPEQSTTLKNNKNKQLMFAYTLFGIDRQVYYRKIQGRKIKQNL